MPPLLSKFVGVALTGGDVVESKDARMAPLAMTRTSSIGIHAGLRTLILSFTLRAARAADQRTPMRALGGAALDAELDVRAAVDEHRARLDRRC